jgi:ADP-ribose pyrophosphatase YjhB (NUDIX family)
MMKVSNYRAFHNEANFAKPIVTQVSGGSHITFEMITVSNGKFYMTRWPKGLPRHDDPPNTLRFPHGLIRFGESLEQCARRLVKDQLGMSVKSADIAYWDAHLDDTNHWHIEPGCIVQVAGKPRIPKDASEIVTFDVSNIPKMTFWSKSDFLEVVKDQLPELFRKK